MLLVFGLPIMIESSAYKLFQKAHTMNTTKLFDELLSGLPDGTVQQVGIGLNWTGVTVKTNNLFRCGLASTLQTQHEHSGEPTIPWAGHFNGMNASIIASLVRDDNPVRVSLGLAALNALVTLPETSPVEMNAEDVIARFGKGKKVALIGHFPFVERLRNRVGELVILEQNPKPGDFPAESAPDVLPTADFVAITAMTLLNGTFDSILSLCDKKAVVMVLGPSTPLSPGMFQFGVDIIAGSIIEKIEPVMNMVCSGGNFRQVHKAGVRLVTYFRSGLTT